MTTGSSNTFVGTEVGRNCTTGYQNVAVGKQSGQSLTTGYENIFIGRQAGKDMTTGYKNIAIGSYAMEDSETTATDNIAIGVKAGGDITTGTRNVAIGSAALRNATNDNQNTAVGYEALYNTEHNQNTAVGYQALYTNNTGYYNVALGVYAGYGNTSGQNNICIGYQAGGSGSPSGSITTGSNNIVLGNDNISNLYCADTTISSSDQRDKTDVTSFNLGLAWVEALRPVTYRWDRRTWYGTDEQPYGTPDGSKKRTRLHVGFLAQEALEVEKANGYGTSNDDSITVHLNEDEMSYGMKYERLVPILVNAIKELSTRVKALEAG